MSSEYTSASSPYGTPVSACSSKPDQGVPGMMSCTQYPPVLRPQATMCEHAHAQSIAEMLEQRRQRGIEVDEDIWLFAYGSLIWRPECPSIEMERGRIHGYHRGLYLWSRIHRGTQERPGLVFGLDRGGSCAGVAFRLSRGELGCHLKSLWQREMPDGSYRPTWVPCHLNAGGSVLALAFVLERDQPNYAGVLPDHVIRDVFATAQGYCGSTFDYVTQTAQALRAQQMPDKRLERLVERCTPPSPLSHQ